MEIHATGRLKYKRDIYSWNLILAVKFNMPGKFFKVRKEIVLVSDTEVKVNFKDYDEFQKRVREVIKDKDLHMKKIEDVVREYVDYYFRIDDRSRENAALKKMAKESDEIKVKVVIEDK